MSTPKRNERVILCNGATFSAKGPASHKKPPLSLSSQQDGNVTIKLTDISRELTCNIPPVAADLLEIAAFVYVADQAVKRTTPATIDYGKKRHRLLRFSIAVRRPEVWRKVSKLLCSTLGFLSDDDYDFQFVQQSVPIPVEEYLNYGATSINPEQVERVVLFSGGLDSLAGAADEIVINKRRVVLVSHQPVSHIATRQRRLVKALSDAATKKAKPLHIGVTANKSDQLDSDPTQRTRSFLFVAMAAVVARLFHLNAVYFYENGVTSVNLPLAAQEVGTRASRTTHPRVLADYQELLTAIFETKFEVPNPYITLTKQDIAEHLKIAGLSRLAADSVSCMHTRQSTVGAPHCALCAQCVSRRIATIGAGYGEDDPATHYKQDVLLGKRESTVDRTIAERYIGLALRLDLCRSSDDFLKLFSLELGRAMNHFGVPAKSALDRLYQLHRRHAEQVCAVIRRVMETQLQALTERRLEESSALMMAFGEFVPARQNNGAASERAVRCNGLVMDKRQLATLAALNGVARLVELAELRTLTDEQGLEISEKTLGKIIKTLAVAGLVRRPHGERSGVCITDDGKMCLRDCGGSA